MVNKWVVGGWKWVGEWVEVDGTVGGVGGWMVVGGGCGAEVDVWTKVVSGGWF